MPLLKRETIEPSSALTASSVVSGLGMLLATVCHSSSSGSGGTMLDRAPRDWTLLAAVAARSIAINPRCITPLAFCIRIRKLPA